VFCALQLLMLTSSEAVMGRCFRNSVLTMVAAWAVAVAIMSINGSLLYDFMVKELPVHWAARTVFLSGVALYLCLVIYFAMGPQRCASAC
jgi:uncharacterized membrane-anchored protein